MLRCAYEICLIGVLGSLSACASHAYMAEPIGATVVDAEKKPSSSAAAIGTESWREGIQRVRQLYRSEQFDQLERVFQELVRDDVRFASGDSKASAAYWAIRRELPAPGVKPGEIERINKWKAQYPDSAFAEFAECRYWYSTAWNARGTSYANKVGDAAWDAFGSNLRKAEGCLMGARPALKATPLWHNLLLAISQDLDEPKKAPDAILEEAAAEWPQYYDFYELRLTRLTPSWGGSSEAVERFISKWSTQQAKLEGDSLYARLYIWMETQGVPPEETATHWPRLKASLRELIARYPDPGFRNSLASYSCRVGDVEQLRETLAAMKPGQLDPSWWFPDAPYDSPKCALPAGGVKSK